MQSTQLACPHCGSTLNFGVDIAAGTPLECLICMRTFVAEHPVSAASTAPTMSAETADPATLCPDVAATMSDTSDAPIFAAPPAGETTVSTIELPSVAAAASKRPGKVEVLASKPYAAPPPSAVYDKAKPTPVVAPTRSEKAIPSAAVPSIAKTDDPIQAGKIVLIAATVGVLFILTGGLLFAAWKISTMSRGVAVEEKIADNSKSKSPVVEAKVGDKQPPPDADDKNEEKELPKLSPEEEANLQAKIREEIKQTLKRKFALKNELEDADLDPIASIGSTKMPITGLDQQKINAAIDKGVAYLRRTQKADGTWHQGHGVGYASIGGLTLLECGADKKTDMHVQKAAAYVRAHCTSLTYTYELSLAILFLDRLGYERDRPLIQGMALKLMAGQTDGGGWDYQCAQLNPKEMFQLYTFLHSHKQPDFHNPLGDNNKTQAGIVVNPKRPPVNFNDPFAVLNELILTQGIDTSKTEAKKDPKKDEVIAPVDPDPKKNPKSDKPQPKPAPVPIRPETLLPSLQKLPIVMNEGAVKKVSPKAKGKGKAKSGRDDNSNTQFALLALWAARRNGVPTDMAILAAYNRFVTWQNDDGSWGYHSSTRIRPDTMTNVGLLGLAMGHGAAPEIVNANAKNRKDMMIKPALEDAHIQHGLGALSRYIGQPSLDPKASNFPMQNLYFLWSVERVAMLYDLKRIGGKDWYGWGAQILVHNQHAAGSWPSANYPGHSEPLNTCFALLFLRRSNLVQDLTNNLRLSTGIADTEK